jgi:ABC-type dipeptide/oligopeptide/nickel transport system permease component
MPTNIIRFERLAYISLVMGVVALGIDRNFRAEVGLTVVVVSTAIAVAIGVALIYLAARRRKNWARWAFSIIAAISTAFVAYSVWTEFAVQPWVTGLNIVSTAFDAVAVYLLFSGDSQSWFRPTAPSGSNSQGAVAAGAQ